MKYREAVIIQDMMAAFLVRLLDSEKIKMIFVTYLLHFFDFDNGVC